MLITVSVHHLTISKSTKDEPLEFEDLCEKGNYIYCMFYMFSSHYLRVVSFSFSIHSSSFTRVHLICQMDFKNLLF